MRKNQVTEKRLRRSSPFCVPNTGLFHQLILKPKIKDNEEYIFSNLLPQASGSEKGRDSSRHGTHHGGRQPDTVQLQTDCRSETVGHQRWTCHGQKHGGTRNRHCMFDKMRVRINRHYQEIMGVTTSGHGGEGEERLTRTGNTPYHTLMQVFRQHNEGTTRSSGGRHESRGHAAEVPHCHVTGHARVPRHPLPCEGTSPKRAYPLLFISDF